MIRLDEIVEEARAETFSGQRRYASRRAFEAAVKRWITRSGFFPVKATHDEGGNCVLCGEAGRCPGYHVLMGGAQ